ncbi:GlsB/YeaQ/YmgE family stress response membrane protein [Escherichia sp. SS-MK2]
MIFGLIAGIIAKLIMPEGLINSKCSISAAKTASLSAPFLTPGWLATMFGIGGSISGFNLHSFLVAVVGAILVLGIFRLLRRE